MFLPFATIMLILFPVSPSFQARDAIINGTHPVTVEQAAQFAGMQCQIQFGDHVETKHKPGFLE